ncbi:MAG: hypothetical protein AAFO84_07140 [Cyanobacteria bacterium J06598_1]
MKRRALIYWVIYAIVAIPLFLQYAASYMNLDTNAEIDSPALASEKALPAAK